LGESGGAAAASHSESASAASHFESASTASHLETAAATTAWAPISGKRNGGRIHGICLRGRKRLRWRLEHHHQQAAGQRGVRCHQSCEHLRLLKIRIPVIFKIKQRRDCSDTI
jgi:hypothetical protein